MSPAILIRVHEWLAHNKRSTDLLLVAWTFLHLKVLIYTVNFKHMPLHFRQSPMALDVFLAI
jgi:hypothetical protein